MIQMTKEQQDELWQAIWTLINSASNEGCDGDLTVVNQSAVDKLHDFVTKYGG